MQTVRVSVQWAVTLVVAVSLSACAKIDLSELNDGGLGGNAAAGGVLSNVNIEFEWCWWSFNHLRRSNVREWDDN